ncbi:MAG: hypothetical protein ABI665_17815 [Vicinamibacterales bacterium]
MLLVSSGASAQQPRPTEDVEVEPIVCWWRTTTSAVRAGEQFGLTLTCSVVETEAAKVVPDLSRLDANVVQLPPFEILGGSHPGDLVTPGKRFIQYDYKLRAIPEEAFGADIAVPPLEVTYNIESKLANGESSKGRDQTYSLPRTSIRLISLVPTDNADIHESAVTTFGAIEARSARANILQTVSTLLFGLAGLVLLVMLITLFRQRASQAIVVRALLNERAILRAASRELADVQRESRGGWTDELTGRALAALRIVGSYAQGRAIGLHPIADGASSADGELLIRGLLGRPGAFVSGSVTAQSVNNAESARTQGLADALRTLTVVRYGRAGNAESGADDAMNTAIRLAKEQSSSHSLIAGWSRAFVNSLVAARKRVWA